MSCAICLEDFVRPVALPCGHVFCESCIMRSSAASRTSTCPMCRRAYSTMSINLSLIPLSLRGYILPYILPPLRRLYFDAGATASATTASPTTASPATASPTTASPATASPTTASPTTASSVPRAEQPRTELVRRLLENLALSGYSDILRD